MWLSLRAGLAGGQRDEPAREQGGWDGHEEKGDTGRAFELVTALGDRGTTRMLLRSVSLKEGA